MAKKPLNALDALGAIPDYRRLLRDISPVLDFVRQHEDMIRQLTTNPVLDAISQQEEIVRQVTQNPITEIVRQNDETIRRMTAMAAPLVEAAERAKLALVNVDVPRLPDFTAAATVVRSLRIDPGVIEQLRGTALTDGIAASVRAMRDLEQRVSLPFEEMQRAVANVNKQTPWAVDAIRAARVAGFREEFGQELADFAARMATRARTAAPEQGSKPSASAATDDGENIAVEVDQIIRSAKTEEERIFTRQFVTGILINIGITYGPTIAEKLRGLIIVLLFTIPNPHPPGSPHLPASQLLAPLPVPVAEGLVVSERTLQPTAGLPDIIRRAGPKASWRTLELFTAAIRNRNTRQAYAHAVALFFNWCENRNLELADITPFYVAAYVEEMQRDYAAPTVKQHLAAIKMLFDYLVIGQVIPMNPAASVRGPKHVVKTGKTPVLNPDKARALLDSIDTSAVVGLRDRALIGVMVYTFARVNAVLQMNVGDYFVQGSRGWVRLHEKGGRKHPVPCHHTLQRFLDEYVSAAGLPGDADAVLFRTAPGRTGTLSANRLQQPDAYRMIQRRARAAGIKTKIGNHTFRATGITAYLKNGGTLETAQQLANHESPRTTKLYDRRHEEISIDEVERITI